MLKYNVNIGYLKNFYNVSLSTYLHGNFIASSSTFSMHYLKATSKRKKHGEALYVVYPILYKKNIFYVNCASQLIRGKRLKTMNFNQSIIMEGSISSKKCSFTFPIQSIMHTIHLN